MQRAMDIERGDGGNVSHLAMGVPSGTRIDGRPPATSGRET
jgi:hypothetical protein